MKIVTSGRTDLEDLFEKSGNFSGIVLSHTPFLVFTPDDAGDIHVQIENKATGLLFYPDETPVMVQWGGEWRSDFFQFTVGDYRTYATARDERRQSDLLTATEVKRVVPKRKKPYMSFRYLDRGMATYTSVSGQDEVQKLSALFRQHGIPVAVEFE